MDKIKTTGGARIGMANATWPFATLSVTKDKLELNASIVGNLIFQPKDIISIETYTEIPVIGQGIKINHRVENYNSKVVFWTFKNPTTLINQIRQTGFLDNIDSTLSNKDEAIIEQQKVGGFPIKKSVVIGFIILWNILFVSDFIKYSTTDKTGIPLGEGTTIAVGILFIFSSLLLISKDFRRLILKDGKSIKDINRLLYLLIFISGIMLLGILTAKS